jgi:hypothetical protein
MVRSKPNDADSRLSFFPDPDCPCANCLSFISSQAARDPRDQSSADPFENMDTVDELVLQWQENATYASIGDLSAQIAAGC